VTIGTDPWGKICDIIALMRVATNNLFAARRYAILAAVALATVVGAACGPSPRPADAPSTYAYNASRYAGGDGLSRENAVVLKTLSEPGGVASEYAWLAHTYKGSKALDQTLMASDQGRRYDVLIVETASGSRIQIWFDITNMYK
jgi:hypothetical protein